jgi:aminopeptidase N
MRPAVHTYDTAYGPYPFKEFDVVENPTPTGVEYPGLVQIAESEWHTGNSALERTVAHETGHQWFYSLVGNDQVNHPWLDEGLTSYTEFVYMRAIHPAEGDDYVAAEQHAYEEYVRGGGEDWPVDQPVGQLSLGAYAMIVYTKSALFLVRLEGELGRETVLRALKAYFHRPAARHWP